MKFAVLSDIHGNEYALREVLKTVDQLGITQLLLLGDYVGYYYGILQVLEQLSRYEYHAIRGNHEDLLQRALKEPGYLETLDAKYGSAHRQCIHTLPGEQLNYLTGLPAMLDLLLEDTQVLLCHGVPWDIDEYVYPDADEAVISKYDDYSYDFIFFGHTHYSTLFSRGQMQVINPGSVGQSRQKGGMAFWGVLDTAQKKFEQMVTPYQVDQLKQEILSKDPHLGYNHKVLSRL